MNPNSNAILTLCSHLCIGDGVIPLEPKEYSDFARRLIAAGRNPSDIFELSRSELTEDLNIDASLADRIMRLVDRNASLCFELEKLGSMGIETVTRADSQYPLILKKKLLGSCPPIFYCAGDLELLKRPVIGFVGSRNVEQQDMDFTKNAVSKIVSLGKGVVSGGAKGVDTIAGTEACLLNSFSVEYLSDSMLKKLKNSDTVKRIQNGNLLMLSVVKPDAGFNVGIAMMRNRYIYAQAEATIVVRSEYKKGGTWAGAQENLKHAWCPTLCWNHNYPGNKALIEDGAIGIDSSWDGRIPEPGKVEAEPEKPQQFSLFD